MEIEPLPEAELADHARLGLEAGVAAVPVVGGPAQVLLTAILPSSFERRRDEWLRKLAELVADLERRIDGFDVRSLADNEVFISGVVEASRIAVGTQLEEKLDLLKEALITLAVDDVRDLVAMRFLRFIGELEPEHFLVLEYSVDPRGWFERKGLTVPSYLSASRKAPLDEAQLPVDGETLSMVLRDLHDRALADSGLLSGMVTERSVLDPFGTGLGRELLSFVRVI